MQDSTPGTAIRLEFTEFMRAYQDMVFSTALRLTASEAQAQDIAQEVFLKAFENFPQLKASTTAGGWLKTVTTNLSLNHLTRYRRRWRLFSEIGGNDADSTEEPEWLLPEMSSNTPLEDLEIEQRQERLEAALAQLPTHQRVPLVLYHFEAMSYEEIALRLRISPAKLKTDIHRGRLRLMRACLNQSPPAGDTGRSS